jgi:hypothetical protein
VCGRDAGNRRRRQGNRKAHASARCRRPGSPVPDARQQMHSACQKLADQRLEAQATRWPGTQTAFFQPVFTNNSRATRRSKLRLAHIRLTLGADPPHQNSETVTEPVTHRGVERARVGRDLCARNAVWLGFSCGFSGVQRVAPHCGTTCRSPQVHAACQNSDNPKNRANFGQPARGCRESCETPPRESKRGGRPSCPWKKSSMTFFHLADRWKRRGFPRSAVVASCSGRLVPQSASAAVGATPSRGRQAEP